MEREEREFLMTVAWMFARHGQTARARTLCEAMVEDDPKDGCAAAALATRQLADGEAAAALATLRGAEVPAKLGRAAAMLEARALCALGKKEEADRRWRRYLETAGGAARRWVK